MITNRVAVTDPCLPGDVPLVNATVYLYGGPTVLTTVTDSYGYYIFENLPPGRYAVDIVYPTCTRRLFDRQVGDSSLETNFELYHKKGNVCEVLSLEDQDVPALSFESIHECCANMFWFDMEGCILRSQSTDPSSSISRFYPTWIGGQLCSSKELFDTWEDSYLTLKECCEAHFAWDYSGCCASLNMGGC